MPKQLTVKQRPGLNSFWINSAALLIKQIDFQYPELPILHQYVAVSLGPQIGDRCLVRMIDKLMALINNL
ncbi:hypothetical protein OW715_07475 [Acidithiobacillus ferriphilus]|nr:hypothetical protein [Acidithiobacillus ferriphilus]